MPADESQPSAMSGEGSRQSPGVRGGEERGGDVESCDGCLPLGMETKGSLVVYRYIRKKNDS